MLDESNELEGLKEITISEILAKIEKGETIHHVIIKCDLNPIKLNFLKDNGKFFVTSKISMVNCQIDGNINFSETIFQEQASFSNSQFNGNINFNNSQFSNDVFFIGTQFSNAAQFNGVEFNRSTIFSHAKFYGPAYFSEVQFGGSADFSYSQFSKLAYFKSDFNGNVIFGFSQFKGDADFSRSNFYGDANFDDTIFDRYANFTGAKFIEATEKKKITFAGSLFNNQASFAGSQFGRDICFSNNETDIFKYTRFKEYVDFQGARFKRLDLEYARFEDDVNFRDAKFSSIVDFSYVSFGKNVEFSTYKDAGQFDTECKIKLRNATFGRLNAHWNDISDHLESPEPSDLNSLVNNYNELGWFDDADNCFLEYKKLHLYNDYLKYLIRFKIVRELVKIIHYLKNLTITRYIINKLNYLTSLKIFYFINYFTKFLLHYISLLVYGHGVRLRWPIIAGAIVLFGSAYIYYSGGQVGSFYPEGVRVSSEIFIATTQVGKTTQVGNLIGFCRSWAIIERFLGWLFMTAFLVVLAKKTLR